MIKLSKILNVLFALICIPINLILVFLADAYVWACIIILLIYFTKKHASEVVWVVLIIITLISITGSIRRPLTKTETNKIYSYLYDKYNKQTFTIKKSSLSVSMNGKHCDSGSSFPLCLGFDMFKWNNLKAYVVDENNIEFILRAELTGINNFENYTENYTDLLKINEIKNYMNNNLIPILKPFNITDVDYEYSVGMIEVRILRKILDKNEEQKTWDEVLQKLQYDSNKDPKIVVVYLDEEGNQIDYYYLWDKKWK